MKSLKDFDFSGIAALEAVIAQSEYGTLQQAVASLAAFSHPDTVRQTGAKNLFPIIRARGEFERKQFSRIDGREIMHDDNWSAKQTFTWANGIRLYSKKDVQYNHVVSKSNDVSLYTNLANLVALPAFLSKLTDTHKSISQLLEYRSLELYGSIITNSACDPPEGYRKLRWAEPLPPVSNVEATMRKRMASCAKDRSVICARTIGWFFSEFKPDTSL